MKKIKTPIIPFFESDSVFINRIIHGDLFDNLVIALRKEGYTVDVFNVEGKVYRYARVTGKFIVGGFCEVDKFQPDININGRIAFHNRKWYDTWNSCPYSFPIPKTSHQLRYVFDKLRYLGNIKENGESMLYEMNHEKDYPKWIYETRVTIGNKDR